MFAACYCGGSGGFCDNATIGCAVRLGTSPFEKTETKIRKTKKKCLEFSFNRAGNFEEIWILLKMF